MIAGRLSGSHLPTCNVREYVRSQAQIHKRAGLDDIRIRDLCHSFASDGLSMIEKSCSATSKSGPPARYAHLANDPVKAAANRIASRIADAAGRAG